MKNIIQFLLVFGLVFVCFDAVVEDMGSKVCVNPEHVVGIIDIGAKAGTTNIVVRDLGPVPVKGSTNSVKKKLEY